MGALRSRSWNPPIKLEGFEEGPEQTWAEFVEIDIEGGQPDDPVFPRCPKTEVPENDTRGSVFRAVVEAPPNRADDDPEILELEYMSEETQQRKAESLSVLVDAFDSDSFRPGEESPTYTGLGDIDDDE